MPQNRRRAAIVATLALVAWLTTGCVTRSVRHTFFEDQTTRIVLVEQKRGGTVVERGFAQPLQIAPVRMAHILSRLDVRTENKDVIQRVAAIPTDALYSLADQVSAAFQAANSNQHLVVYYTRRSKRFGVFDRNFLTSFLAFADGDYIFLQFGKIDWEIPKQGRREVLPEPSMDDSTELFTVVASTGMSVANPNMVAIDWRNPIFKKPTRTHVAPGGGIVRRTILMESPEETAAETTPTVAPVPASLSSATLRALADLEDERKAGDITEADYEIRRRQIIDADPASR